jgi:hypothetical protein
LEKGYTKESFYYFKKFEDRTVYFSQQDKFRKLLNYLFDLSIDGNGFKKPDEAYLIIYNDGNYNLKIVEKKNQNGSGSTDEKILAGPMIKIFYNRKLKEFGLKVKVEYVFVLSDWFRGKLSDKTIYGILEDYDIPVFYGDAPNYFEKINEWLNI